MTKKYHISWLIAWVSVGLLIGTFLSLFSLDFVGFEWLVVAICLAVVSLRKNGLLGIVLIFLAGMLLGLWRGGNLVLAQQGYDEYLGQEVQAVGTVDADPTIDIDGDIRFLLRDVTVGDRQMSGELWVSSSKPQPIKRSDKVLIEGQLDKGFGTIPSAVYRAEILAVERPAYADVARDVRDEFAEGIRTSIQEPEASLGAGFLLGQKSALPEDLEINLRLLGLTHIVVASGYNLTILIRFSRKGFARISRFTALTMSGGLVYCFALLTGWSPSMTRAGLIAGISLLAWYYGRKLHPFVLLSFSAALTVFINPTYAWGDIGWLLSFTAFIGVIVLGPLLHAYFWGPARPGALRQVVIETLSAQILTLPIIALIFGQYSILALPANLLIVPLIPLAMALTFIAGIAGLLLPGLAPIIGWPAELLLRYMTGVIDRMAQLPLASSEISISGEVAVALYLLILGLTVFLKRRTGFQFRDYNIIE